MHCMIFRNSVEPAFCVTFEADITRFKRVVKEQGVSFTLAMVYAVCKCANDIDAFRYRFVDGQIVLFDKIDTAFTYLNQETELFKVVNVPMIDDLKEYCEFAETIAKEQKEYFTGPLGNDVFNVLLCRGSPTRIFLIPIPGKRIMQPLCLIGENFMRRMGKLSFQYQYRHIIPLLTAYILGNL